MRHDLFPLRTLPSRGASWLSTRMTELGERHGIDALTYHPAVLRRYHAYATVDAPAVMRSISSMFPSARTYLDVGAGSGAFAAEAKRRGRDVVACERSRAGRFYARSQGVRCVRFDLDETPPADVSGPFDLAYCFEVAEHLEARLGDQLVDFLAPLAQTIVFTAARPGQGGIGHVNEQPKQYWVDRFGARGISYRGRQSQELAERFRVEGVSAPWLLDNVMVYGPPEPERSR